MGCGDVHNPMTAPDPGVIVVTLQGGGQAETVQDLHQVGACDSTKAGECGVVGTIEARIKPVPLAHVENASFPGACGNDSQSLAPRPGQTVRA